MLWVRGTVPHHPKLRPWLAAHPAAPSVRAVVALVSVAFVAGCGGGEPPPLAEAEPRFAAIAIARATARLESPALAATRIDGAAHDRFAADDLRCEDCHSCGRAGHPPSWTDPASPRFHAVFANRGLARNCATCHGPALDGTATAPACARCHDSSLPAAASSWKVNCVMCHGGAADLSGAPPRATWGNGGDAVRVGAHATHGRAGIDCATCHPKPADALAPGHADGGTAAVAFAGLAAAGGAAPAWDRASATCASTYCHGATLGGGAATAPRWTEVGTGQTACGSCHGAPPPAPHPQVERSACAGCHPDSVDASGQPRPAPGGKHLDGAVQGGGHDAAWTDPSSPGFHAHSANQGLAACAACHGASLDGGSGRACARCHDQGLPAGVASWKVNCVMCHGGVENATGAPPEVTFGNEADPVRSGAHSAHVAATHALSAPVPCAACHLTPADALAEGHVDGGTAEIAFGALALRGGAPTFTRADATCASTYCHGATLRGGLRTTPSWTSVDPAQRACGACHGATPAALGGAHPPRTDLDCGGCHPGYSVASATVVAATHVDGVVQQSASCSSCHGSGAASAAAPRLAAPPAGTRGETATTARAVGAHATHLDGGPLTNPIACAECHAVPTSVTHRDGTPLVTFGPLARTGGSTPTWTPGTARCASTWCHGAKLSGGSNRTPSWTTVNGTQDACGTCHGRPPSSGEHGKSDHRVSCSRCHGGTYTTSSADRTRHVNGTLDLDATATGWNATARSCSAPTGGCHGGSRKGPW